MYQNLKHASLFIHCLPGSTVKSTRKNLGPNSARPKFRNKINDDYDSSGEVQQAKPLKNRSSTTSRPSYKYASQCSV